MKENCQEHVAGRIKHEPIRNQSEKKINAPVESKHELLRAPELS